MTRMLLESYKVGDVDVKVYRDGEPLAIVISQPRSTYREAEAPASKEERTWRQQAAAFILSFLILCGGVILGYVLIRATLEFCGWVWKGLGG